MFSLDSTLHSRVPRPPFGIPDPFRRIRVADDLDEVTTRGAEVADVDRLGMTAESVQIIWDAAQRLYRTGMYPAIGLCVRRHGEVVLDRAIGHARGNGPSDPADGPRVPATPETPFVIFC